MAKAQLILSDLLKKENARFQAFSFFCFMQAAAGRISFFNSYDNDADGAYAYDAYDAGRRSAAVFAPDSNHNGHDANGVRDANDARDDMDASYVRSNRRNKEHTLRDSHANELFAFCSPLLCIWSIQRMSRKQSWKLSRFKMGECPIVFFVME
jgi:hypothetical protein